MVASSIGDDVGRVYLFEKFSNGKNQSLCDMVSISFVACTVRRIHRTIIKMFEQTTMSIVVCWINDSIARNKSL